MPSVRELKRINSGAGKHGNKVVAKKKAAPLKKPFKKASQVKVTPGTRKSNRIQARKENDKKGWLSYFSTLHDNEICNFKIKIAVMIRQKTFISQKNDFVLWIALGGSLFGLHHNHKKFICLHENNAVPATHYAVLKKNLVRQSVSSVLSPPFHPQIGSHFAVFFFSFCLIWNCDMSFCDCCLYVYFLLTLRVVA